MATQSRTIGTRRRHAGTWNVQALADLRSALTGNKYKFDWEPDEFGHVTISVDSKQKRAFLTSVPYFYEYLQGKGMIGIWQSSGRWYMYDHDQVLAQLAENGKIVHTASWKRGVWSYPKPPAHLLEIMSQYIVYDVWDDSVS